MSENLITLIRIAIGKDASLSHALSYEEWKEVSIESSKQTVIGLVYQAIEALPDEVKPDEKIVAKFAEQAEKIRKQNRILSAFSLSIYDELSKMGMKSVLLKGQGTARYYTQPARRSCGDIDIWVEGDTKETIKALASKWELEEIWYHHTDIRPFNNKVSVEVHFHPSWMNNPFANRRLLKYFSSEFDRQAANRPEGAGLSVPTMDFNLFFNLIHIYRHILLEGVGLRQVIDYYHILRHSSAQERQECMSRVREYRMERFTAGLMYVLHHVLDMDPELAICAESEKYGEFLISQIFAGGNFGRYDSRNTYKKTQNYFQKAVNRLKHIIRYLHIAPGEVLWAPGFKLWQLFWKKFNGYR